MLRKLLFSVLITMLVAAYPAYTAASQQSQQVLLPNELAYCEPSGGRDGSQFLICMPEKLNPLLTWNKDVVIFAHGYVPPKPILPEPWLPLDQLYLVNPPLPVLVNQMHYAFAMTSYPENGLAIQGGVASVNELASYFKAPPYNANNVFLIGASEGGLVTTLAVEKYPEKYAGGLAICGPIGSFRGQVDHFGDFRVVFDYFFPGAMPGTAINPGSISDAGWKEVMGKISTQMATSDPTLTKELYKVTKVPVDFTGAVSPIQTAGEILWYNYFATADAAEKLKGNPFGNRFKWYSGSSNDRALNSGVARFTANPNTLNALLAYNTSGKLTKPLVTMHTTGDPVVPYWHETLYNARVMAARSLSKHINIPILRYGHCAFEVNELLAGFALMKYMATGELTAFSTAEKTLPTEDDRVKFRKLINQHKD